MNRLVVVESGCLIVRSKVVLRRIRSCRLLSPRVLDWDVGSNCVIHWFCSTCAGGSCDSNVPSCDMCNTQLRGDLSSFLLLIPFAYTLLVECILLGAWLRGLFLHFQRHVPWFVLPMYPLHSGRSAYVGVSTLLGGK